MTEKRATLWSLVAPPATWASHFLLSYITAAIWCAKAADPIASLAAARTAIFVYTAVALAIVAALGWQGWRRHAAEGASHEADTARARDRFLGHATFLLSALSGVAIVYAAIAVLLIGDCR